MSLTPLTLFQCYFVNGADIRKFSQYRPSAQKLKKLTKLHIYTFALFPSCSRQLVTAIFPTALKGNKSAVARKERLISARSDREVQSYLLSRYRHTHTHTHSIWAALSSFIAESFSPQTSEASFLQAAVCKVEPPPQFQTPRAHMFSV